MTEEEWLSHRMAPVGHTWAARLLQPLKPAKTYERKLRLVALGYCRRLWPWMLDPCRKAIVEAERCADGHLTLDELFPFWDEAQIEHVESGSIEEYAAKVVYFATAPMARLRSRWD